MLITRVWRAYLHLHVLRHAKLGTTCVRHDASLYMWKPSHFHNYQVCPFKPNTSWDTARCPVSLRQGPRAKILTRNGGIHKVWGSEWHGWPCHTTLTTPDIPIMCSCRHNATAHWYFTWPQGPHPRVTVFDKMVLNMDGPDSRWYWRWSCMMMVLYLDGPVC